MITMMGTLECLFATLEPNEAMREAFHYLSLQPHIDMAWLTLEPETPGHYTVRINWAPNDGRRFCADTPVTAQPNFTLI